MLLSLLQDEVAMRPMTSCRPSLDSPKWNCPRWALVLLVRTLMKEVCAEETTEDTEDTEEEKEAAAAAELLLVLDDDEGPLSWFEADEACFGGSTSSSQAQWSDGGPACRARTSWSTCGSTD